MPLKVNKLRMTGFRGATTPVDIHFDTTKPVVLIFGENGTGKSTIADAFDFICNRQYGSLENYSLDGQSPKNFVAALGKANSDVRVSMSSNSGSWEASIGQDGPLVHPETGCPDARILRRRTILELIEKRPQARFEALKSFLAVPKIEKSENALRVAIRAVDNSVNEAARAIEQAAAALEKLWISEGKSGTSSINWAKAECEKDISTLQGLVNVASALDPFFKPVEDAFSTLDGALAEQKATTGLLETALSSQQKIEARQSNQNPELIKLLQDAKSYVVTKSQAESCPVCEQGVDSKALTHRLGERVLEMEELAVAVSSTTAAKRKSQNKTTLVESARTGFCQKTKALGEKIRASATLTNIQNLNLDWNSYSDLLSFDVATEEMEKKGRGFWNSVKPIQEPLKTKREAEQKSITLQNAIKGYVDTLTEKRATGESKATLLGKLNAALEIVAKERKTYVEEILEKIASEVERLYAQLHPDEGLGGIRFYLKPNAIGSLQFDGQFQGTTEIPPQAYYSESHLDTLGICVFLALSKYFKTPSTVIILDDVLTSVDNQHLNRFMDLLHQEAKHFNQMLITTHYRPWREKYRWAKGPVQNTHIIELGPWNLRDGIQTQDFMSAVDELKNHLAATPFDRQASASKAGIVLESLLDFITLRYRCSIPRNARNEFTLGDLASALDSKLSKVLRISCPATPGGAKIDVALKPIIDKSTSTTWVRNSVGCHFSALESGIPDSEVRDFSGAVISFASSIICASCGMLPLRRPSGSNWECKCGALELYPLIYPGADPNSVDSEG